MQIKLKMRLLSSKNYSAYFQKAIKKLDKCLAGKFTARSEASIWLLFRILDEESKQAILNKEILECLPE
jgi:hypothetical protein